MCFLLLLKCNFSRFQNLRLLFNFTRIHNNFFILIKLSSFITLKSFNFKYLIKFIFIYKFSFLYSLGSSLSKVSLVFTDRQIMSSSCFSSLIFYDFTWIFDSFTLISCIFYWFYINFLLFILHFRMFYLF